MNISAYTLAGFHQLDPASHYLHFPTSMFLWDLQGVAAVSKCTIALHSHERFTWYGYVPSTIDACAFLHDFSVTQQSSALIRSCLKLSRLTYYGKTVSFYAYGLIGLPTARPNEWSAKYNRSIQRNTSKVRSSRLLTGNKWGVYNDSIEPRGYILFFGYCEGSGRARGLTGGKCFVYTWAADDTRIA